MRITRGSVACENKGKFNCRGLSVMKEKTTIRRAKHSCEQLLVEYHMSERRAFCFSNYARDSSRVIVETRMQNNARPREFVLAFAEFCDSRYFVHLRTMQALVDIVSDDPPRVDTRSERDEEALG